MVCLLDFKRALRLGSKLRCFAESALRTVVAKVGQCASTLGLLLSIGLFCSSFTPKNDFGQTVPYTATAYCLRGRTASGAKASQGMVATGSEFKLGTRVHLSAGSYSGEYIVADRGVPNHRIDIWMPTKSECKKFGRRKVHLTRLT